MKKLVWFLVLFSTIIFSEIAFATPFCEEGPGYLRQPLETIPKVGQRLEWETDGVNQSARLVLKTFKVISAVNESQSSSFDDVIYELWYATQTQICVHPRNPRGFYRGHFTEIKMKYELLDETTQTF